MSNKTAYFLKEIVSNQLALPSGRKVKFEDIGDDMGALVTNEEGLIKELRAAQDSGVGGVREVTQQVLEDAKKNAAEEQSRKLSRSPATFNQLLRPKPRQNVATPAVATDKKVIPVGEPLSTPDSLPPSPVKRRKSRLTPPAA